MSSVKNICLLGATGSIGDSTLGVLDQHPEKFRLHSVAALRNWEKVLRIAKTYQVNRVCLFEEQAAELLRRAAPDLEILQGLDGLIALCADSAVDVVVNGLVGAVGCLPTLEAVKRGKTVALANKETMVMAGPVIREALRQNSLARIVPIDSEHNAVYQCLANRPAEEVETVILTASGGPFRDREKKDFETVTVNDALRHPTWSMGRKITIDSASMMNKGLEVIEAHFLFNIGYDQIRVVVHPKSIVHSLVQFRDGSLMAQMGVPDMKIPIQVALTWPERLPLQTGRVDLARLGTLDFYPPDFDRFPCLRLAYEAGAAGGIAPAVLNAANEVLVAAFLDEKIGFMDIPRGIEDCLSRMALKRGEHLEIEDALAADAEARRQAAEYIRGKRSA